MWLDLRHHYSQNIDYMLILSPAAAVKFNRLGIKTINTKYWWWLIVPLSFLVDMV